MGDLSPRPILYPNVRAFLKSLKQYSPPSSPHPGTKPNPSPSHQPRTDSVATNLSYLKTMSKRSTPHPSDEVQTPPKKKARIATLSSLSLAQPTHLSKSKTRATNFLFLPSELRQHILFQPWDRPNDYYHFQWGQHGVKPWHYDFRLYIRDFLSWARDVKKVDEQLVDDMDFVEKKWIEIYDEVCVREELAIWYGN
jgi:hypothetical protein